VLDAQTNVANVGLSSYGQWCSELTATQTVVKTALALSTTLGKTKTRQELEQLVFKNDARFQSDQVRI
jgi:hypothetical protein